MPKSLAELRAEKPRSLPERSVTLCLAPHLVAQVMALTVELDALPHTPAGDDNAPPRIGVNPNTEDPRADGIRTRIKQLLDEMAEYDGELRVRATDDGVWRRWVNAHPARKEGEPGAERDLEVAGGYCNADDLLETLGTYACAWNGEVLDDGDWEILAASISGPDKKQIATAIVTMHESRLDFQQWRSGLSTSLQRSNGSSSRAPLGSLLDDSLVGSPSNDTSTTTQTES